MSKNNRGTGLRELPRRGRGECPLCGRTAIKLVYEVKKGEETLKVCKNCRHKKFEEPKKEEKVVEPEVKAEVEPKVEEAEAVAEAKPETEEA